MQRATRRVRNPYRMFRREGESRIKAARAALMVRRSSLGPDG